jgi:L-ribulose-5-phosphate 4-epimerase
MAEGLIGFDCRWTREPVSIPQPLFTQLTRWRAELYRRGLVGVTPDGVGFGNISTRLAGGFVITGSATGAIAELDASHYALVDGAWPAENRLACRGLTVASSESLSHAALYDVLPGAGAVIHVHSAALWERYRGALPTTSQAAEHGTPALAAELAATAAGATLPGVVVMGGHRDGLISFGSDLEAAGGALLALAR